MVYGITATGERLGFERWAFNLYQNGLMRDGLLRAQFQRCSYFYDMSGGYWRAS